MTFCSPFVFVGSTWRWFNGTFWSEENRGCGSVTVRLRDAIEASSLRR
jgi:hypothetical protein